jgi:hypothetical protein
MHLIYNSKKSILRFLMLMLAGSAAVIPARADLIISTGISGGNQYTGNVVFNDPLQDLLGPALWVRGHIQNGASVDFLGKENLIANGGQAQIDAQDGGFQSLLISLTDPPGGTFTKAIFDLDASAAGHVTIQATELGGQSLTGTFGLDQHGNNFFTTIDLSADGIKSILITSDVDLSDIKQIRMGTGPIGTVPEPAGILLLGSALLGVLAFHKRRISNR